MYNTLKRLFNLGMINETGLNNAINKGWISEAQKQEIVLKRVN